MVKRKCNTILHDQIRMILGYENVFNYQEKGREFLPSYQIKHVLFGWNQCWFGQFEGYDQISALSGTVLNALTSTCQPEVIPAN